MSGFTCFESVNAEFKLFNEHRDFEAAKNRCREENGHLASVRNQEEFDLVLNNVSGTQSVRSFWIGEYQVSFLLNFLIFSKL